MSLTRSFQLFLPYARLAVSDTLPITAKIRLDYDNRAQVFDNVKALSDKGTSVITIHAGTKTDGNKPPFY